eukprot:GFKZ01011285.1.p2 GENE.GFKZ01011285.1~~GFKZ01011285.1.p2  ORF type:complete len:120 (-),score=8.48 GFKZ01011285.1:502-861(-)
MPLHSTCQQFHGLHTPGNNFDESSSTKIRKQMSTRSFTVAASSAVLLKGTLAAYFQFATLLSIRKAAFRLTLILEINFFEAIKLSQFRIAPSDCLVSTSTISEMGLTGKATFSQCTVAF